MTPQRTRARHQKRPRGLSGRILTSGLPQAVGLDALLLVALAALGATVYRLSPDLVPGYAGVILIVLWWILTKAKVAKGEGAE